MADWDYIGEGGFTDLRNKAMKRSGRVTLDNSGVATISFSPAIIMEGKPRIVLTPHVQADSSGLVAANVVTGSYTQDSEGRWTGCTIIAARVTKKLPVVTLVSQLSGLTITDRNGVGGEVVDWLAF